MRLRGLDLNLLVAFDVLLRERNVSHAARKLNLSQSAASSALGRLRRYFDDEILVAHGRRMYITPLADDLWPQVRDCLRIAEGLIATSRVFDASTSRRVFRVVASDYITTAIFAPIMRDLAKSAPNIEFEFVSPDPAATAQLDEGVVDLLITPLEYTARDQPVEILLEDQYVVVGWSDNVIFQSVLTEGAMFTCGHVAVAVGTRCEPSFADRHLQQLRKPRRIETTASSFAQLPWFLVQTDRLAVVPLRLAQALSQTFAISRAALPFAFPPITEMMQIHESRVRDEGLRWLRERLRTFASTSP